MLSSRGAKKLYVVLITKFYSILFFILTGVFQTFCTFWLSWVKTIKNHSNYYSRHVKIDHCLGTKCPKIDQNLL